MNVLHANTSAFGFVPHPTAALESPDSHPLTLADGRVLVLSPIGPGDAGAEGNFVGALSLDARYRRFHFGLRELTPEQLHEMTAVDQRRHVAYVARPAGEARIVADVRYVRRADSAEAEFAIVVADDWQHLGLGRELMTFLAGHARRAGVARLFGDVLWGNPDMLGLVRHLGGSLRRIPSDATVARAEFVLDADEPFAGKVSPNALGCAPARA